MAARPTARFCDFGPFRIDRANRLVLRDGSVVPLKPKVVDTLLLLADNRGRVVTKEEGGKTVEPVEELTIEVPDDHPALKTKAAMGLV